ncbi:WD40/YVTN/BNR-like repeat-containing protein [Oceanobacillus sojae]|uniref:WD40/YVTN/BNR-like repeat-containing protein n=1 Tax=Oceanobacillus sojae TaxID=582851 RepID=UPI0009888363|nr:oxidoreductase [Oceanobacillus sojae]
MKPLLLGISGLMITILTIISFIVYQKPAFFMTSPFEIDITERTADPADTGEQVQEELQPVDYNEPISYSLQNNKLHLTYDSGEDWTEVPIETDQLFAGDYNGPEQELIDNSYVLTEDRAAFLHTDTVNPEQERVMLTYSTDKGETWEESEIASPFPGLRFRKVDFLDDQLGYVIISGSRTMSQEYSTAFLTEDGGETWQQTNSPEETRLIADGGFVDESTGFLSLGTISPEAPTLYVTQDKGESWQLAEFNMPEEYEPVFVIAETPVRDGEQLTVTLNQGPNGDYAGGLVKGEFISDDNGETWNFSKEVEPDETE